MCHSRGFPGCSMRRLTQASGATGRCGRRGGCLPRRKARFSMVPPVDGDHHARTNRRRRGSTPPDRPFPSLGGILFSPPREGCAPPRPRSPMEIPEPILQELSRSPEPALPLAQVAHRMPTPVSPDELVRGLARRPDLVRLVDVWRSALAALGPHPSTLPPEVQMVLERQGLTGTTWVVPLGPQEGGGGRWVHRRLRETVRYLGRILDQDSPRAVTRWMRIVVEDRRLEEEARWGRWPALLPAGGPGVAGSVSYRGQAPPAAGRPRSTTPPRAPGRRVGVPPGPQPLPRGGLPPAGSRRG